MSDDEKRTGHYNTGHSNTGNGNTGYRNTGDWNTGNGNTGYRNTGHYNTGHSNTGHSNTGNGNTGYRNTGDWNTGHYNTGYRNTGDWNTGHYNTGDWNICHYNTGYFNTITPQEIFIFNRPCGRSEWDRARKPDFIFALPLTYWVSESDMTDDEKKADPNFWARGGQLRKRDYKEAWRLAWESAGADDRALLEKLPNFDAEVFKEISGIDVNKA